MTSVEQYNKELYHYGVKGMKWGVRNAIRERDAIIRKHDRYVNKYQRAKDKGKAAKAAKYEGKAWKERAKFELAQEKINKLDPERVKKAQDFVNQLMQDSQKNRSTTSTISTSTSGSNKQKKRYFEMNEVERKKFDDNYTKKRKQLIDRYKSSTNASEKARIEKQVDKLENDYLDEVERDW